MASLRPPRKASSTGSSSAGHSSHGGGHEDSSSTPTPPPLPVPRPFAIMQKQQSTGTACSRDDLRREVSMRGNSLTVQEQAFLDQLAVHGNEIEVQLAMERLLDKELFFSLNNDTSTPRSLDSLDLRDPPSLGLSQDLEGENNSGPADGNEDDDDQETRDSGTEITVRRQRDLEPTNEATASGVDAAAAATTTATATQAPPIPPPGRPMLRRGSSSSGSQRRLKVLEQRRQCTIHGKLWKAHENGLALTRSASRRSLLNRSISGGSTGGGGPAGGAASGGGASTNRSMNASANSAYMSVGSMMNGQGGKDTIALHSSMGVLRLSNPSTIAASSTSSSSNNNSNKLKVNADAIFRSSNPMVARSQGGTARVLRRPLRRPHSMMIPPRNMRSSSTGMLPGSKLNSSSPNVPPAAAQQDSKLSSSARHSHSASLTGEDANALWYSNLSRPTNVGGGSRDLSERSTGSRKSVTFAKIPFDNGMPIGRPSRVKHLRRAVSDSIQYESHHIDDDAANTGTIQDEDLMNQPPIRDTDDDDDFDGLSKSDIDRSTSISSIPSIRHATAVRCDSISSIPSLHHGRRLRSDESFTSIPSLHHGHPLQMDDSIRTETATGDVNNGETMLLSYDNSDARSTSQVAAAWLEQRARGEGKNPDDDDDDDDGYATKPMSRAALPKDISITVSTTPKTVTSTHEIQTTPEDDDDDNMPLVDPNAATPLVSNAKEHVDFIKAKPVLMRQASKNAYEGEGIEVTDANDGMALPDCSLEEFTSYFKQQTSLEEQARHQSHVQQQDQVHAYYRSMMSLGDLSIRTCSSWDDSSIMDRGYHPRYQLSDPDPQVFRNIRRCLSDEDMSNLFLGTSASLLLLDASGGGDGGNLDDSDGLGSSWDMNSDTSGERFDSWNVLRDDYVNGYGGGGTLDFRILGTSGNDESAQPHVLSPPLMESLQAFLPFSKSGENFYLKYSLIRDGASFLTFLQRARGTNYTILAMETVDGEVFGSFTAQAWRKNWNYFGTGESFLWRMRRSRLEKTHSILEQAQMESEIDVYPFTGENRYIQLCTHDRLAVGGGSPYDDGDDVVDDDPQTEKKDDGDVVPSSPWATSPYTPVTNYNDDEDRDPSNNLMDTSIGKLHEWGFGLSVSEDLLTGTSARSMTFGNPPLSKVHSDGSIFEIVNLELWTLTPCVTTEEAEKLELGKLFLERG